MKIDEQKLTLSSMIFALLLIIIISGGWYFGVAAIIEWLIIPKLLEKIPLPYRDITDLILLLSLILLACIGQVRL